MTPETAKYISDLLLAINNEAKPQTERFCDLLQNLRITIQIELDRSCWIHDENKLIDGCWYFCFPRIGSEPVAYQFKKETFGKRGGFMDGSAFPAQIGFFYGGVWGPIEVPTHPNQIKEPAT